MSTERLSDAWKFEMPDRHPTAGFDREARGCNRRPARNITGGRHEATQHDRRVISRRLDSIGGYFPWFGSNVEGASDEDPRIGEGRRDTCAVSGLGSGVTAGESPGTYSRFSAPRRLDDLGSVQDGREMSTDGHALGGGHTPSLNAPDYSVTSPGGEQRGTSFVFTCRADSSRPIARLCVLRLACASDLDLVAVHGDDARPELPHAPRHRGAAHRASASVGRASAARATTPCAARTAPDSSGSRRAASRSSTTVCRASASAASGARPSSRLTSHDTMACIARSVAAASVSPAVIDSTLRTSGVTVARPGHSSLDFAAPLPGGAALSRAVQSVPSRGRSFRQVGGPASIPCAAYPVRSIGGR